MSTKNDHTPITKPKNSPAKTAATVRYHKAKTKLYGLRFLVNQDAEIIKKLDSVSNKVDYVRQLINKDISNNEKGRHTLSETKKRD